MSINVLISNGFYRKIIVFVCSFLIISTLKAQNIKISLKVEGVVLDATTNEGLVGTSIQLVNLRDSLLVARTISDSDGRFNIYPKETGTYNLFFSYIGYKSKTIKRKFDADEPLANLDTIFLESLAHELAEVDIEGTRLDHLVIRNDTLEFNSSFYKTDPDAVVNDLLKKVPGLRRSEDGSLIFNGKIINQLLLDGKPYFNNNNGLLLKTVPAEFINKIQIYTDSALHSGSMTLNLTLKPEFESTIFGRSHLGKGNKNLYSQGLNLNRFAGDKKISFSEDLNNTNSSEYTPGVNKSATASFSYMNKISRKTDVSVSTNFGRTNSFEEMFTHRVLLGTDTANNYQAALDRRSKYHRFDIASYLYSKLDSQTTLQVNQSFNVARHSNISDLLYQTILGTQNSYLNRGENAETGSQRSLAVDGSIILNRTFDPASRFNLSLNYQISPESRIDSSTFEQQFYLPIPNSTSFSQLRTVKEQNHILSAASTYETVIDHKTKFEVSNRFIYSDNRNEQIVDHYNPLTDEFELAISDLSAKLISQSLQNETGFKFGRSFWKIKLHAGATLHYNSLSGKIDSLDGEVGRKLIRLSPVVQLSFDSKAVLSYNKSFSAPSVRLLHPAVDNSNPLFLVAGNPDLKHTEVHSLNFYLNSNSNNFFLNLTGSGIFFKRKVSNTISLDSLTGIQSIRPVNVDGSWIASTNLSLTFPTLIKNTIVSFNSGFHLSEDYSYLNGARFLNSNFSASFNPSLNYTFKSNYDLGLVSNTILLRVKYSGGLLEKTSLISQMNEANVNWRFQRFRLTVASKNKLHFGQLRGLEKSVFYLNAELSYFALKNKQLVVNVRVNDVFNQNISNIQIYNPNYIESIRSNVLGRYSLFTVSYSFNRR